MRPSFWNAPEPTTVSSAILSHCSTVLPGGSAAARVRATLAPATTASVSAATADEHDVPGLNLHLSRSFAYGGRSSAIPTASDLEAATQRQSWPQAIADRVLAPLDAADGMADNSRRAPRREVADIELSRRRAAPRVRGASRVAGRARRRSDAERRRIERGLHDGVQQHLVALAVNLQLARRAGPTRIPPPRRRCSRRSGRDVREALERVRELAQRDLSAAAPRPWARGRAAAAAPQSTIPARVDADGARAAIAPTVEATVYFCCVEALERSGTRAGARRPSASGRATSAALRGRRRRRRPTRLDEARSASCATASERARRRADRLSPAGGTRVAGTIPVPR